MPTTTDVIRAADTADFTFRVGALTEQDLLVTAFRGTEGIGKLFHFRVELCSENPDVPFDDVVGKPCVLQIRSHVGMRYVNAIVQRFERVGEGSKITYYAAEIVPTHWILTRRVKSRIFQENNCPGMTVPDIVKKVLTDAGLPADSFNMATTGTHPAREYIVQYRESDFDFISRLCEEEGIYFYFEHTATGHKMVFGDALGVHKDTPLEKTYIFKEPTGLMPDEGKEFIMQVRDGQQVQVGAVMLSDFNFTQPQTKLRSTATGAKFTSLEYSDYPGEFADKSAGDTLAKTRLEEFQSRVRVQTMRGGVRALIPGFKFTLTEHPTDSRNIEYLVVQIRHNAFQPQSGHAETGDTNQAGYSSEIETIPASVQFRPPRVTPRPVVHGTQTAVVVGPSGEEIYTDKYGRVKVQFHWDREGQYDENSSCWVRVSQGIAGGQYGMMFLPRIGQEVVVDFLEGDADHPIIIGRVYNNDNMPAYALPDEKTKSYIKTHSSKGGGGTNEIRFEDKKDSEQLLINATKDMHLRTKENRVSLIGKDEHLTVKGDAFYKYEKAANIDIKTDQNQKLGGNHSLDVTGDAGMKVGGKQSIDCSGNIYIKSGGTIVIEASSSVSLKAGGNFITIDSGGVAIKGTMVKLNSGGSAGSGSAVSLTAPGAANEPDEVKAGADITYSPTVKTYEAFTTETISETDEDVSEQREESWIEIELKDDDGNAVPGEEFCITLPNGRKLWGNLNQDGLARVGGIKPGQCEVTFPRLDKEGWRR